MAKKSKASQHIKLGGVYLFRTVTHYHVGRVSEIHPDAYVLTDAAWIADTGRFSETLKDPSKVVEVEPFVGPCILFRGGLIDATPWSGQIPMGVK